MIKLDTITLETFLGNFYLKYFLNKFADDGTKLFILSHVIEQKGANK